MATKTRVSGSTIAEEMEEWLRQLDQENRAELTQKGYRHSLNKFVRYLREQGMPETITGITREHIEAFIISLLDSQKASTAALRYRVLKGFFNWAAEEHIDGLRESPMARMHPPRVPETPPDVLTDAQIAKVLKTCHGDSYEDVRDTALIRLLFDTGCRRAEILGLRFWVEDERGNRRRGDVDLGRQPQISVLGKGSRWRTVALDRKTASALHRYERKRAMHPQEYEQPAYWLSRKGALTDSGLAQMLLRRGQEAGMGDRLHAHQFRHAHADRWLAAGGSEIHLMRDAGWRSPTMLQRYGARNAEVRAAAEHRRLRLTDGL